MKPRRELGTSDYKQLLSRYDGKKDSFSKRMTEIYGAKLAEAHRARYKRMEAAMDEVRSTEHQLHLAQQRQRRRRKPGD